MFIACAGACAAAAAPAAAAGSYSPYNETATEALSRYVRALATNARDFQSLIGAGKSALELGDTQAAAGFFARADDISPRSPLPHAGMGAVAVANGDPRAALPYFARAQQLGAPVSTFGCDRGLAYDLMGQQALAQADYRAALGGRDSEEARRRLALSLAISGDRAAALEALAPLLAKGDRGAQRARALVQALSGDPSGAMVALDLAMPGSRGQLAPFLQRLPALGPGQKAAAVNLGIFPDSGAGTTYAYSAPPPAPSTSGVASSVSTDRLAGIDSLLGAAPSAASLDPSPQSAKLAYVPPELASVPATSGQKIWLQLASGSNESALSNQYRRMKSRGQDLFDGIKPYVAKGGDRARLVIGPFRGAADAETLAQDLVTVGIDAFKWSNSPSDVIVPLGTE
jgi:tetratricopeptide (TPR) repeat protein